MERMSAGALELKHNSQDDTLYMDIDAAEAKASEIENDLQKISETFKNIANAYKKVKNHKDTTGDYQKLSNQLVKACNNRATYSLNRKQEISSYLTKGVGEFKDKLFSDKFTELEQRIAELERAAAEAAEAAKANAEASSGEAEATTTATEV